MNAHDIIHLGREYEFYKVIKLIGISSRRNKEVFNEKNRFAYSYNIDGKRS